MICSNYGRGLIYHARRAPSHPASSTLHASPSPGLPHTSMPRPFPSCYSAKNSLYLRLEDRTLFALHLVLKEVRHVR